MTTEPATLAYWVVTGLFCLSLGLLKEWAYAGFSINLLGATASHLFAGDPLAESLPPLALVGVLTASYVLRPPSRRLRLAIDQSPAASASAAPAGSGA